jgi:hypothetical protein
MAGLLVLLFPVLLLVFMLFMGKVEEPLNRLDRPHEMEEFLDEANPAEMNTFVREGADNALRRFRQRMGLGRRHAAGRRRSP